MSITTRAVAPATPATAKADNPMDSANIPAPAANAPKPNKAMAPASPNKTGTKGPRNTPARPITANAPASIASPLAISPQLIPPKEINGGIKRDKAAETIANAAAPEREPLININAAAIIPRDPARTTSPLAISSQLIPPKSLRALDRASRATATMPIASAPFSDPLMSFEAPAMMPKDIARAPSPLARVSRSMEPNRSTTSWNMSIAPPRIAKEVAVAIILVGLTKCEKAETSSNKMAMDPRPLPIEAISISPNLDIAEANICIAPAIANNPSPVLTPTLPRSDLLNTILIVVIKTITEPRPLASVTRSIEPSFSTAPAIIRSDMPNMPMAMPADIRPFSWPCMP